MKHKKMFLGLVMIIAGLFATSCGDDEDEALTILLWQAPTISNPYLANGTKDSVLEYHTALEFHGRAYSVHWRIVYISERKSLPVAFALI